MNIEGLSAEFLESLTDEQKIKLIQDLAANQSKPAPEPEPPKQLPGQQGVNQRKEDSYIKKNADHITTSKGAIAKATPVQGQGINLFSDDGSEFKDDPKYETPEIILAPRDREAPQFVEVICNRCNRKFDKRQDLIGGTYHVCDKCGRG